VSTGSVAMAAGTGLTGDKNLKDTTKAEMDKVINMTAEERKAYFETT
jgi:hypothetical protein